MKPESSSSNAWNLIEQEKRRDRFVRRVAIAAWTVTLVLVLLFAVAIGAQVAQMLKVFGEGGAPLTVVFWSAMPLVVVLGVLSLLIAVLSTVGIFLRLRTASLTEIQLRLAALEQVLASRPDPAQEPSR